MKHVLIAAAFVLYAGHASAHAHLKTATPAVGSTVQQPPAQVVIDFTGGGRAKLQHDHGAGRRRVPKSEPSADAHLDGRQHASRTSG